MMICDSGLLFWVTLYIRLLKWGNTHRDSEKKPWNRPKPHVSSHNSVVWQSIVEVIENVKIGDRSADLTQSNPWIDLIDLYLVHITKRICTYVRMRTYQFEVI